MDTFWNGRINKKIKKEHNERINKDKIIRNIRSHFEQQEEDYYVPKKITNFWDNNYIEYECNGDKNRKLSLDKYISKIKPYLRNIIINLQNSDVQLTYAINFISLKDAEEKRIMHSNSGNINFTLIVMQMMLLVNSLSQYVQDIKKT